MGNNRWILGLVVIIIAIGALSIWGFKKNNNSNNQNTTSTEPQVQGEQTNNDNPKYFAEDAKVKYFYSDSCSWCIKQKVILQKLGDEGYKVKPMNVGEDANLWKQYNIEGTPTFIADNGERLTGYQEYDQLKAWLDKNK